MKKDHLKLIDNTQTHEEPQHEFGIQRVYLKDLSYEAPHAPDIFQTEWTPKVDLDIHTHSNKLSQDVYEVTLRVTVTTKINDKIAFLIEVEKAGIFTVKGFNKEQLDLMLASFCPNILFPYARELVSSTINRGNFPPLYLAPVNFDALYQEQLKKSGKKHEE
jgi:preprotein translocase subunit SecB